MTRSVSLACSQLVIGHSGRGLTPPIDLCASPGEVWAVVGRNGCGKTTLLRTLLGLNKPISGHVSVSNRNVHALSPRDRATLMAYVPQREGDGLDLSAREFVATGRYAHSSGVWEDSADKRAIEAALEWAQIGQAHKPLSQFSGGERQRLTLARAMAQETPVVLMDEPGTHLDPAQSRRLGRSVAEMASQGKTVLVVSHDIAWCVAHASNAILMGEDVGVGSAEQTLSSANLDRVFG